MPLPITLLYSFKQVFQNHKLYMTYTQGKHSKSMVFLMKKITDSKVAKIARVGKTAGGVNYVKRG